MRLENNNIHNIPGVELALGVEFHTAPGLGAEREEREQPYLLGPAPFTFFECIVGPLEGAEPSYVSGDAERFPVPHRYSA